MALPDPMIFDDTETNMLEPSAGEFAEGFPCTPVDFRDKLNWLFNYLSTEVADNTDRLDNLPAPTPPYTLRASLSPATHGIADWDDATENGWYSTTTGATNTPNAGIANWMGFVVVQNPLGWMTQTAHAFVDDSQTNTMTYRREMNAGNWTAWYRVYQSEPDIKTLFAAPAAVFFDDVAGTKSWTVPANVYAIDVYAVGGGASGGGSTSGTTGGTGGGAGACGELRMRVEPGFVLNYTVAASQTTVGGAADGADGFTTTIGPDLDSNVITCPGGGQGRANTTLGGGAPFSTGGRFPERGGGGELPHVLGGNGGASRYGSGGIGTTGAGGPGLGYGAGGAGGHANTAGGAGNGGFIGIVPV